LFVELGPAIAVSPGGATPSFAAFANFRLQPSASWSVSALGVLPFAGGAVESESNAATLRSFMLGGMFDLHAAVSGVEISAGAGSAVLITRMRADVAALMFKKVPVDDRITGAILARAGIHFTVAPRIRLGARVLFGLAIPQLEVDLADKRATWGRPFVLGVISLDFGLPAPTR
jgi:hypothetical protein